MGRTLQTFRIRLITYREKYTRLLQKMLPTSQIELGWIGAHRLSAPASTLPWPDTESVVLYTIFVQLYREILLAEKRLKNESD